MQIGLSSLYMVVEVVMEDRRAGGFELFVQHVEARLLRAFTLLRGDDAGRDATAEALAWAWEHWDRVQEMSNPVGYLYRVGSSLTRRRETRLFFVTPDDEHRFEPGLVPALERLPDRQRTAVVLVHGCGWTHQEVADALSISRASVGTHVSRAMARLRKEMGVTIDG